MTINKRISKIEEDIENISIALNELKLELNYAKNQKEVDWSKVTIDTPILVRAGEGCEVKKRYFSGYKNGKVFAFRNGLTSRNSNGDSTVSQWDSASLDLEAESIINWIPNTGIMPDCKKVLTKFADGSLDDIASPDYFEWSLSEGMVEYAIIE